MYFVQLQDTTTSFYGKFITETEVDLFMTRRGWLPKTDLQVRGWQITIDNTKYIATLTKNKNVNIEFLNKDLLPKGEISVEVEDLVEKFYEKHFQTI